MNFSKHNKLSKVLSLILVLSLMLTLFAGCSKDDSADDTSSAGPNLVDPADTSVQTDPTETEPVEVKENMGTVTAQVTVRKTPNTDAPVLGNLFAGDRVEISRTATVAGYDWYFIKYPDAEWAEGWVVKDYIEPDVKPDEPTTGGDATEPTEPDTTTPNSGADDPKEVKGVVTVDGLYIREKADKNSNATGKTYNRGDVITILETSNGWGRTNLGWVSMQYVTTNGEPGTPTGGNNTGNDNKPNEGNGSTTVVSKGVVTAKELNIRSSASTAGDRVGSYTYGDRVEILEKSGDWGRTSKGWISLNYVYIDGTAGQNSAGGIVTGSNVNIRSGPGTGYGKVGSANAGDRINILEQFTIGGTKWGCTSKGWICLDYVYVDGTGDGDEKGTITGDDLNIRSGPGTNYGSVGKLMAGEVVTILYKVTVGDTVWGNISKGWISMDYVDVG